MAAKIKIQKLLDNATPTQKEALLDLEAKRYNVLGESAELKFNYDTAKGKKNKELQKIETNLSALLEAIESGQTGLPFDDVPCPACEGKGKIGRTKCENCSGKGVIPADAAAG